MHSSHKGWFGRMLRGAAVLVMVSALAGCGAGGAMNHNRMSGMATANPNAPFDQQFLDMMVPHHMMAVEMAKTAQRRAEHPELKTLAGSILAAQDTEIGQMKSYRKAWYGSDATPPMEQMPMLAGMPESDMAAMMHMMDDMQKLQTAMPFDRAFLAAMIPHHQSAVDAAKLAQQKATKPEIKTLAGAIIADQQREIEQMNGWMQAWYSK